MPKLKKSTEKIKAQNLTKPYIEARFNQAELARRRGVTRQTINEQVNCKLVQEALQKYLDSPELQKRLKKVAQEGLGAKRTISAITGKDATGKTCDFIDVLDHKTRHKFWRDLMNIKGYLRQKDNKSNNKIINIVYGHRVA